MHSHPQHGGGSQALASRRKGGQWLKSLREAAGLSQLELARAVGVEYYTFISQIESGRGRIPPERYAVWARAFGVPTREFVIGVMRYYDPVTWGFLFGEATAATNDTGDQRDELVTVARGNNQKHAVETLEPA